MTFFSVDAARRTDLALQGRRVDDPVWGASSSLRRRGRRNLLHELEDQLAQQSAEVRAERDELAVAERVLERVHEQLADKRASAVHLPGQVDGRSVMLTPHREPDLEETSATSLPPATTASARLPAAGLGALADLGFRGLDDDVRDPVIVTGIHAIRTHKLIPGQKDANPVLVVGRAPVDSRCRTGHPGSSWPAIPRR
ncbi:hypothetical protein ACQF4J_01900 [Streptomyces sp. C1-1]|uniref:hypothetical protein n=1 Tax=Streptomyces sp. C1-1 TaxID=3231173 RepID=UPI003D087EEB